MTDGAQRSAEPTLWGLLACAVALEACFLAIHQLGDLGRQIPNFLLFYLLAGCVYLAAVWIVCRDDGEPVRPSRSATALIWTAAIVFRLTLVSMTPGLSDDLARYRWQGQMQAAGGNPYLAAPADEEWRQLRDSTWPRVTRKELASAYGPLLELAHWQTYRLASLLSADPERQEWLFKLPFALLELGTGAALWLLLGLCGIRRDRALAYLWSPLVLVEFWAQGHNDSLAIVLMVLALAAGRARRWSWAWTALTGAILAKIWPILLAPLFLFHRQEGRWRVRWKPLWAAATLTALVVWPYAEAMAAGGETLLGFAGGWRNNASLYGWILAWTDGDTAAATRWAAAALLCAVGVIQWTKRPRERAALWSIAALLLLAANCFPWYLTWLTPLLALYPNAALLLWTLTAGLAYHVVTDYAILGVWEEVRFYRRLEYWPVFALFALGWLRQWRRARAASQQQP